MTKEEYLEYLKATINTITELVDDVRGTEQILNLIQIQFQIVQEIYRVSGPD